MSPQVEYVTKVLQLGDFAVNVTNVLVSDDAEKVKEARAFITNLENIKNQSLFEISGVLGAVALFGEGMNNVMAKEGIVEFFRLLAEELKPQYEAAPEHVQWLLWTHHYWFFVRFMEVSKPPATQYHGFTCPNCGSHYFGSSHNATKGFCHGHQHYRNGCLYQWDRNNPKEEGSCMVELSMEVYMAQLSSMATKEREALEYVISTKR